MKRLLLPLLFFAITSVAKAQNQDTVVLISGKVLTGHIGHVYKNYFFICKTPDDCTEVKNAKVQSVKVHTKIVNLENNLLPMQFKTIEEFNSSLPRMDTLRILYNRMESGGRNLKNAGTFGLVGLAFSVVGGVVSGLGAVDNNPAMTYVGLGFGAAGLSLDVVSLVHLFKGGHKLSGSNE